MLKASLAIHTVPGTVKLHQYIQDRMRWSSPSIRDRLEITMLAPESLRRSQLAMITAGSVSASTAGWPLFRARHLHGSGRSFEE